jgi:holo-[acyl-carrier protein] synthase
VGLIAVGTDLVEIARIARALERHGERFAERILSPREQTEWRRRGANARVLAKRFAAKEAAAKALGTGVQAGVRLHDLEVLHDELGKPLLHFSGGAAERAKSLGAARNALSISDERLYALAFVVLSAG